MDAELFKAARDGNIEALLKLLERDPLLLEGVATANNPLHVAAMLGHLDFAKELLKHKSDVGEYAKELNQHGYSPMHLAAANGHLQVVEMLLGISRELCCVKGRDGVNAWNETALHVAIKNNQFESLRTLVEGLKQCNNLVILNSRDVEGNTVLHPSAATKNHQASLLEAVELLVNCNDPGVLEVNATNKSGLSALDLFILCPCESGSGAETMRLLGRLGAARAQDSNPIAQAAREGIKDLERYFEFRLDRDNPSDVRNALLVVAVLMATATYQAGLEPPGKALLATNPYALAGVMLANSAGFLASMNMIVVLTHNFPFKFELFVAGLAMGVTNGSAMITLAPQGPIRHTFIALSIIMPLAIYICRLVKARIKQHRLSSGAYRRHASA
ncbi:Ankyrin repeat-containing protein BDA1 [Vitis vinifera]|uniref:Ankyrin repeat-containing protein BDA1 n=2 Tax=Vitis vinifera TaxID=29760 RepID=A0A438ESU3_VITVI|nr:Ankyrin repeat-containing protein BDA1 [Vitis vinifera]